MVRGWFCRNSPGSMDTRTAVQRVQQLKERLTHTQDPKKETGIGKIVNGFRKNYDVGDIAKAIVHQWKKLVPDKEPKIDEKQKLDNISEEKRLHCPVPKKTEGVENRSSSEFAKPSMSCKMEKNMTKNHPEKPLNYIKRQKPEKHHSKDKDSKIVDCTEHKIENDSSSPVDKKKRTCSDKGKKVDKNTPNPKSDAQNCTNENSDGKSNAKNNPDEGDSDTPSMSFESYLSYDLVSNKRKKRTCPSEPPRKVPICKQYYNAGLVKTETSPTVSIQKSVEAVVENVIPVNAVKKVCLEDLLDVPLPKFLPDYVISPSPPHQTDDKVNVPEMIDLGNESSGFTGRRLNSKMLVYSGSKTIYLPKMLTLYAQCIRVLQNNIDSIQEVGGVPYDILLPILERCTPQQLGRIEEFNPAFTENSGQLWKKHCQWDFKGQALLEYESWREMYFRLFNEREEKLKLITHSISSAHSGKPKGRQVKLAYVHGAARPPLYIRRKQELNGTAGQIAQPLQNDKSKAQKSDHKDRTIPTNNPNGSTAACVINGNNPMSGQGQDSKKAVKRIAPMMAKSMRAFRNRVGPR
uniref:TFIIS N-terminal domain-containing protein n=1 Tax=Leptobrachium leishanense TaxID=445787 RepID=A0A8C5MEQ2_9ANUR